ncbi:MAG: 3-hydroxyacyl-ACP dehydratase FabZ [candidate division WOR-3 bacterium]|nr:3-hydroxyacyl-ACP dehydratase FabZ [candidate division WOR-3 bacterium]
MMEIYDIKKILPHRYPFLFIDRVIEITDKKIECIKNVTIDEPFFQGHFPDYPLMPGVLMIEAMAQAAGIVLIKLFPEDFASGNGVPLFLGIEKARFRKMVRPGDTLKIICEIVSLKGSIAKAQGKILVGEDVVCEGELLLGFSK